MGDSLTFMLAYSYLISLCIWICAIYLTAGAVYGVYRDRLHSKVMLVGIAVFDAALLMDKLLPMFEPIRLGWFNELAGGLLVLLTGFVMAMEVARQYHLRQEMEILLDVQREQYERITQNIEQTKAAQHDMRHQLAAIRRMTGEEIVKNYVAGLLGAMPEVPGGIYCENYAVNAVFTHYLASAGEGIKVDARLNIPAKAGRVSDMDLCVIMGNLMENALEACTRTRGEGFIRIRAGVDGDYLSIIVENSFDGDWDEQNGVYFSRKRCGSKTKRRGLGLLSVKAVCAKYDGIFKAEAVGNVWHSSALADMGVK